MRAIGFRRADGAGGVPARVLVHRADVDRRRARALGLLLALQHHRRHSGAAELGEPRARRPLAQPRASSSSSSTPSRSLATLAPGAARPRASGRPRRCATSDLALRETRKGVCGHSTDMCGSARTLGGPRSYRRLRYRIEERDRWQPTSLRAYHHRHRETDSGAFFKVAAVLLGILVAVLGMFALLMWADARKTDDATNVAVTALNRATPAARVRQRTTTRLFRSIASPASFLRTRPSWPRPTPRPTPPFPRSRPATWSRSR